MHITSTNDDNEVFPLSNSIVFRDQVDDRGRKTRKLFREQKARIRFIGTRGQLIADIKAQ